MTQLICDGKLRVKEKTNQDDLLENNEERLDKFL